MFLWDVEFSWLVACFGIRVGFLAVRLDRRLEIQTLLSEFLTKCVHNIYREECLPQVSSYPIYLVTLTYQLPVLCVVSDFSQVNDFERFWFRNNYVLNERCHRHMRLFLMFFAQQTFIENLDSLGLRRFTVFT